MPFLPDLIGRIRIDTSDLDTATGRAQAAGSAIGTAIGGIAALGIDAALSAISDFVSGSVDAFAQFEDAAAAAGVRFGESVGIIEQFAATSTEALGISRAAAIEGANQFAVFGKAAGLAGDDLAQFSVQMVTLAGDMASFSGGTPEEAIQAIGAAFRGETDPIERYGVLINQAAVKNKALELGLITQGQELDSTSRIMATQALILEQTSDAHGDFQRNIEGTANQQKLLAARSADASIELGERLAPAFLFAKEALLAIIQAVTGFVGVVSTVVGFLWQWRDAVGLVVAVLAILNAQTIAANVALAAYLIWLGAVRVATTIWTAAQWLLNAALTANPIGLIVAGIAVLVGAFIVAWNHSETFRTFVTNLWGTIVGFAQGVIASIVAFGQWWGQVFGAVGDWIQRFIAWVGALPGQVASFLGSLPGIVWQFIVDVWQRAVALHNQILFGMVAWLQALPGRIGAALAAIPGIVWNLIVTAFQTMAQAAVGGVNNLLSYLGGLPGRIISTLASIPGQMVAIGADIIGGLLRGLQSAAGRVVSFLTGLIPGPVKAALGIASPSRVMQTIGVDVVRGLVLGMEDMRGQLRNTSLNVAADAISAIQTTNVSVAGAQAPGGGGGAAVIDARSYGTQLQPRDVADAIMWSSRVGGMVPA